MPKTQLSADQMEESCWSVLCRMPSQAKVDRSANQVLSFNVIPAAPKLEVCVFTRPPPPSQGPPFRPSWFGPAPVSSDHPQPPSPLPPCPLGPLDPLKMPPSLFCQLIIQQLQSACIITMHTSSSLSVEKPCEADLMAHCNPYQLQEDGPCNLAEHQQT